MIFLGFIAIPLLILLAAYFFSKEISWKELASQVVVAAIVASISVAVCYYSNTTDTEVWNGVVAEKKKEQVSCSHSYRCNCHTTCTGTGNTRSCSESCSTCYEHPYDYDWNVHTSNGERFSIARIDSQGTNTPPRWSSVRIGEPTTIAHSYENFIKASPGSLFRKSGQMETFKDSILTYPEVYDYHRMDRLMVESGTVADSKEWNEDLAQINARLGQAKQVNVMVIITTKPREFFFALEESWIGGKKNDAILVIGVDNDLRPVWTEVMAWVLNPKFKIVLKDEIAALPKIDRKATLDVFEKNVSALYQRKPMHDFEYLKASIVPTTTQWIVSILIGIVIAVVLSLYFHNYDPFNDSPGYNKYRYRY